MNLKLHLNYDVMASTADFPQTHTNNVVFQIDQELCAIKKSRTSNHTHANVVNRFIFYSLVFILYGSHVSGCGRINV